MYYVVTVTQGAEVTRVVTEQAAAVVALEEVLAPVRDLVVSVERVEEAPEFTHEEAERCANLVRVALLPPPSSLLH